VTGTDVHWHGTPARARHVESRFAARGRKHRRRMRNAPSRTSTLPTMPWFLSWKCTIRDRPLRVLETRLRIRVSCGTIGSRNGSLSEQNRYVLQIRAKKFMAGCRLENGQRAARVGDGRGWVMTVLTGATYLGSEPKSHVALPPIGQMFCGARLGSRLDHNDLNRRTPKSLISPT
jgi:hypothetical protein